MFKLLISVLLISLLSCGGNRQTPVDNPSYIDRNPQFEPLETTASTITAEEKTSKSVSQKIAAAQKGQKKLSGVLTDYKGQKLSIDQFDGKPKVLGYWASWCEPCLKEKPYFKALSEKYAEVEFISISIDKELSHAIEYFKTKKQVPEPYDYWIGYNPDQALHWYTLKGNDSPDGLVSITSIPKYVLISKNEIILNNDSRRGYLSEKDRHTY